MRLAKPHNIQWCIVIRVMCFSLLPANKAGLRNYFTETNSSVKFKLCLMPLRMLIAPSG
jgi:hypothetical protein